MPLEPAFVVSATSPVSTGYVPGAPGSPFVNAWLTGFGVLAEAGSSSASLPGQLANDEMILGYDPVDPADENGITDEVSQLKRHNTFWCAIDGHNVRDDHQYLLIYGFKRRSAGGATVQFFVGSEWVLSESIDNDTETIALLLDAPGPGWVYVYARLASEVYWARVGLTGIEGFLI